MATFSETYNAVADQFGDNSAAMITRIKRYINYTQQDVASRRNWSFLMTNDEFTTTATDNLYSLNADAEKVINMNSETNKTRLQYMSRTEFDAKDPYSTTTGVPEVWVPAGVDASNYLQVQLSPTPNGAYDITYWYRKRLSDLSNDSDVSAIPLKYHKLLYLGALAQTYEYDENPLANNMWSQYENMLADMEADLESGSEDSVPVMRSVDENFLDFKSTLRLPPEHFRN